MISPSTTTAPFIPDQIDGDLYISDIITARAILSPNYHTPHRPRIRYILSLLHDKSLQPRVAQQHQNDDFVFKLINLRDRAGSDLLVHLEEACKFIASSLDNHNGGVLVHCQAGVSRSASVVLAYLMQQKGFDYDEALHFVRQRRPMIKPNQGFEQQLRLWRQMDFDIHDHQGLEKEPYTTWKHQNNLQYKQDDRRTRVRL